MTSQTLLLPGHRSNSSSSSAITASKKFVLPGKGESCGIIGVAGVWLRLALDGQQQGGLGAERLGSRDQQEVRVPRER